VAAVAHTRAAGPPADRHPHWAGGAAPGGVQAGHPLWGAGLQAGGGFPGRGSRSTSPAASTTCCSPCRCRSCCSPGGTTSRRGTKRCGKARERPDRASRRADPPGGRPRALGRLPGHLPPADPAGRGHRSRQPGSASREHRGGRATYQAVCSPFRNDLPRRDRQVLRFAASSLGRAVGRVLVRAVRGEDPSVLGLTEGPYFDNQFAALRLDGRHARLELHKTLPGDPAPTSSVPRGASLGGGPPEGSYGRRWLVAVGWYHPTGWRKDDG
jgi:hypothetical protein